MKLDGLVRYTDRVRKSNAAYVRVVAFKAGRNKKGLAVAIAKTYTRLKKSHTGRITPDPNRDSRYVSSITFKDKSLNVKVSCSCPDYMYRWEFANAQRGVSDIYYCNGEPPDITNPGHKPSLCKHLYALRLIVKSKYNV